MAGVQVVTDSSCDLPAALAAEQRVEIVPLTVRFGDEELVDRLQLSPQEFWERCSRSAALPETAAPSPGSFEEKFRQAARAGATGVACVTISSKLSATAEAARAAARAVEGDVDVRVLDSRTVTMGLGLVTLAAARRAGEGASLDEVAATVEETARRTHVYGTLDTLENLKRGGRIGGAQALIGSMLSIKPVVEVRDGRVEPESRQRTRSRALRYLADKVAAQRSPVERLAVVHGQAPDLEPLLELLGTHVPRDDIIVADLGAVIGTHTGPRTIGVAFQLAS